MNKTYMESHKLDLMSEVADLRLRLQAVETEKTEYRERYEGLQVSVITCITWESREEGQSY